MFFFICKETNLFCSSIKSCFSLYAKKQIYSENSKDGIKKTTAHARFFHLLVGAGFARPNTLTNVFVGAFGQANPAPTGIFIHLAF